MSVFQKTESQRRSLMLQRELGEELGLLYCYDDVMEGSLLYIMRVKSGIVQLGE